MDVARPKHKQEDIKYDFQIFAGAGEKQKLVEVVEFLKRSKRFTKLGAYSCRCSLEDTPGTGKTLLAKAVAGSERSIL